MSALHSLRPPVSEPGAATRERILEAAEALFAEQGYAASIRQITADAGCNLAAISYHFGGKERLYEEVFRRRLLPLQAMRLEALGRAAQDGDETLEDFLRAYATAFLETWVDSRRGPTFMRLLSRESIELHLPPGFLAEYFEPVHAACAQVLRRFCPGLAAAPARHASHSFVGLLSNALNLRRSYGASSGEASLEVPVMAEHIVQLMAGGIRALAVEAPVAKRKRR